MPVVFGILFCPLQVRCLAIGGDRGDKSELTQRFAGPFQVWRPIVGYCEDNLQSALCIATI